MSPPESNMADAKKLLREMVAEAQDLKSAAGGSVTDAVAAWLAAQYLVAAREKISATGEAGRFEMLRMFVQDWAMLRRGDHSSAKLQLEREQLDWQRANGKSQKEQEFREWIQRPEIRRELFPERKGGIAKETMRKIERELRLL